MRTVKDKTGEKYGKLTPTSYYIKKNKQNKNVVYWICNCDCGNVNISVRSGDLGRNVNSCG